MTQEAAHLWSMRFWRSFLSRPALEPVAGGPCRVVTFPHNLRYLMAWNMPLRSALLQAVMHGLAAHYRR